MRKVLKLRRYWKDYRITLRVGFYEKGNLAIQMLYWDKKEKCWLPWDSLTVNLEGRREKDHAFIDTNHNGEEILAWILRHGLAAPTGKEQQSGLCTYPEYRFREKALMEFDKDGYEEYLEYLEELEKLEKRRAGKKGEKQKSA